MDTAATATEEPVAPDGLVAAGVLALGAAACAVLAVGTVLLTLSALARIVGRSAHRLEAAATHLTPALLRRAVAVTLTTGVGLAGAVGTASATEIDLGWTVTTQAEATAPAETTPTPRAVPDPTGNPGAVVVQTSSVPIVDDGQPEQSGQPSPLEPAEPGPATAPPAEQTFVTVSPGDTLWALAAAHLPDDATDAEIATAWPRWYALNESVIGTDPDLIRPGQHLLVPDEPVTEESR